MSSKTLLIFLGVLVVVVGGSIGFVQLYYVSHGVQNNSAPVATKSSTTSQTTQTITQTTPSPAPIQPSASKDCGSVSADSLTTGNPSASEQANLSCFISTISTCSLSKLTTTGQNGGSIEIIRKDGQYCTIHIADAQNPSTCKIAIVDLAIYGGEINKNDPLDSLKSRVFSLVFMIGGVSAGLGAPTNNLTGKQVDIHCVKN